MFGVYVCVVMHELVVAHVHCIGRCLLLLGGERQSRPKLLKEGGSSLSLRLRESSSYWFPAY
jgi:hypothetical protein